MVIHIPGLLRMFSRLRGVVVFFPPRHPQGEAIALHPIQRKTAGKVAENLVGNGMEEVMEWWSPPSAVLLRRTGAGAVRHELTNGIAE